MGHTQLRIGVQGGRVEHRGETEVKVVQKEERGGGGKNKFFGLSCPYGTKTLQQVVTFLIG